MTDQRRRRGQERRREARNEHRVGWFEKKCFNPLLLIRPLTNRLIPIAHHTGFIHPTGFTAVRPDRSFSSAIGHGLLQQRLNFIG
jgi:hypothetical protein